MSQVSQVRQIEHFAEVPAILVSVSFSLLNKTLHRLHHTSQLFSSLWAIFGQGCCDRTVSETFNLSETLNRFRFKLHIGSQAIQSDNTRPCVAFPWVRCPITDSD